MSVFTLKIIALITMLIDHIGEFLPQYIPIYFRWIGRLSAPIFMFCVVQGLVHTSSRKKYLIRLYIGSVIMAIGDLILNLTFQTAAVPITNNIFTTLFLMCFIITLAEAKLPRGKKTSYFVLFAVVQAAIIFAAGFILIGAVGAQNILNGTDPAGGTIRAAYYQQFLGAVIPSILFCEGGPLWIILGVLLYVFRNRKTGFITMYVLMSFYHILTTALILGLSYTTLFELNFQWMMVFSLPFMLLYNGQKGRGMKYLFYLFYPLHIWGLFLISNLLV